MLLQPEVIHIVESHMTANPDFKGGEATYDVNIEGKLFASSEESDLYRADLLLELVPKPGKSTDTVPYHCKLNIIGNFRVSDKIPADKIDEFVGVNGLSILYGSAREHILSLTGRGPWPPLCLPCVSFREDSGDYEAEVETAPVKKRRRTPATKSKSTVK